MSPSVFLGKAFAGRLPMKAIHWGAAAIFAVLGLVFLMRAAGGLKARHHNQFAGLKARYRVYSAAAAIMRMESGRRWRRR